MHMTFRWYGEGNDTVTLEQIRQIPGVEGIVWALHNKQPGEIWEPDDEGPWDFPRAFSYVFRMSDCVCR